MRRFTYHGFGYDTLAEAIAARDITEASGYVATHSNGGQRHVIWDSVALQAH